MPKTHLRNAWKFDTLLAERLFHLWWATRDGYLTVDLKRQPPSNRGMVKQMIADGLFGKKQGSALPLTQKGRDYLKKHGQKEYDGGVWAAGLDTLDEYELDLRDMLIFTLQSPDTITHRDKINPKQREFVARGLVEKLDMKTARYANYVRFRPTPAGTAILEAATDKQVRIMIDKSQDVYLRKYYGPRGLAQILAAPLDSTYR